MRSLLLSLAFALGALTPAISAQDPPKKETPSPKDTKKFASKEGGYKIAFPAKPEFEEDKIPDAGVAGELVLHMAIAEHNKAIYFVSWTAVPKLKSPIAISKFVVGMSKGLVSDGKLVTSKAIEFGPDKIQAREVLWTDKRGGHFRAIVLHTNGMAYQVAVGGNKALVESDEAKAFLNSMEFTEPEK